MGSNFELDKSICFNTGYFKRLLANSVDLIKPHMRSSRSGLHCLLLTLFLTSGLVYHYHLDVSISSFRGCWWMFSFLLYFQRNFCLNNTQKQVPGLNRVTFALQVKMEPKSSEG